jgi:hypothetical protein
VNFLSQAYVLPRLRLHMARQGELVSNVSNQDSSQKAQVQGRLHFNHDPVVLNRSKEYKTQADTTFQHKHE